MLSEIPQSSAPLIAYLEHREPDLNCFRFYRMEVERDLFGAWTLMRSWGRIGTQGRDRIDSFDSCAAAEQARDRLAATKTRRGYVALAGTP